MTLKHAYALGQGATIEVSFFTADGAPAAPDQTKASILIRNEAGAIITRRLDDDTVRAVDDDETVFETDVTVTLTGKWHYRGESTEGLVCAAEGYFTGLPTAFD